MTQAAVAANYFEGGRNLTRGASEDDADLATIINNLVADIVAAPTAAALALALADTTPASEGASLIGTDAKANLGASTTVEGCLTSLNTKNSPSAAQLASIVGGSEGASLIGTDAKPNLGAATTVEGCLTEINAKNPPTRTSGAGAPAAVGAVGDIYVDTTNDRTYVNVDGTATGWRPTDDEDLGAVACLLIEQSGVPVAGQLLTIGADVYEADGAGANINFVIGAAEATMDNLLAAAVASGTEDLFWDKIDATHLRVRSADAPQGNVIAADPGIVISENLANYTLSTGTPGNLNTEGGRAKGVSRRSMSRIAVTAAHVAQGEIRLCFPFAVTRIGAIQALTAAGAQKFLTETFAINNGDILVSVGTGATPLIATDIVTVEAWS